MTKFVTLTLLALLAGNAAAQESAALQEAAKTATMLCFAVDRENSLEACGNMAGRSPEHTAARKAMIRMYNTRTLYVDQCKPMRGATCPDLADLQIGAGMWAAYRSLGLVR